MSLTFNSTLDFNAFLTGYSVIMFSMWGIGVDVPRLILRYGKAYPLSINIHSISMVMIGLFTIMYVISQIALYTAQYGPSYSSLSGAQYGQFISSIILASLVVVQFLLGFMTRVKMFKSKVSRSFFTVKLVHKVTGYCIWILGKVVATFIVNTQKDDITFRAWLFALAGIAIIFIILQVVYRAQSRTIIFSFFLKHKNKQAKYHNDIFENLIQKKQKFENYKAKGVRYVLIDNCMYYIDQNFMHPGGEAIFNILNGKEINYYLKGAKAIAPNYPRHLHTKYVAKYLQHRLIGEIGVDSLVINQKISSEVVEWKIVSAVKTNYDKTYLISFETDAGNVREQLRLQNMGKYIMMGCSTEQILSKTERPYYICMSVSEIQIGILDRLRKYYKYYYFREEIEEDQEDKKSVDQTNNRLYFFIKEVKYGTFTKFLLNAPKDRIFSINGPYGRGLNLKEKTAGYYILIASDMGITAYIDFITFLLQKTLYDLIKAKASSPSLRKISSGNNNRYQVLSDLRVLLVGSFNNSMQFYLSTAVKQLYYLNLKHGLKSFNLMLHYANGQSEQEIKMVRDIIGKQFFTSLIQEEQPDRVFFSGSDQMQQSLRKVQSDLKLKNPIEYI